MVTFLGPGVRKVQIDPVERALRYLLLKNFNRVMGNESKILDSSLAGSDETMANTRLMNFYADKIPLRAFLGLLYERVTVAKTDFERSLGVTAEELCEIEPGIRILKTIVRPQFLECPFL
jgi:hypothetical protein